MTDENLESKLISVPSLHEAPINKAIVEEQSERSQMIQIIEYICKDCFTKKSKEEALL
jgi:hypothetical protein